MIYFENPWDLEFGCDLSKWQGDVDFAELNACGMTFAILKASQGLRTDPRFDEYAGQATDVLPYVGAYHLIELDEDPKDQAEHFAARINELTEFLPESQIIMPCLDVETSKIDEVSPGRALDGIHEFAEELIGNYGFRDVVLYISPRGLRHLDGETDGLDRYPRWHVEYVSEARFKSWRAELTPQPGIHDWAFWQFTSSGDGRKYGVSSTRLDLNFFNTRKLKWEDVVCAKPIVLIPELVDEAIRWNSDQHGLSDNRILQFFKAGPWQDPKDTVLNIAKFQKNHGLLVTGKLTPETIEKVLKKIT